MDSLPRPDGGDQNRGPKLLAVFWTQVSICIVVIAMRMYSRSKLKTTGVDDWVMVVILVLFIALAIAATFNALKGGGRHLYYLSPDGIEYAIKTNWIEHPFGIMAPVMAKIFVALLILRLIGPLTFWRRWFLYLIIFLSPITGILTVIFEFASCDPPRALWVPLSQIPGARCWNPESLNDWNIFAGAYNSFIDFCLALLPLSIVWNLNLNKRRKFALSILLSLGILAGICSVVKATYIPELTAKSDFLWDTYDLDIWTVTEISLLIICASIPTMKPIYDLGREHVHFNLSYFISKYNRTKPANSSRGFDGVNIKHPYQHHADDVSYSHGHDGRPLNANRGLGPSTQIQRADSDEWTNGDGNTSIGMGDIVVQRGWEMHRGVGVAKLRGDDAI